MAISLTARKGCNASIGSGGRRRGSQAMAVRKWKVPAKADEADPQLARRVARAREWWSILSAGEPEE